MIDEGFRVLERLIYATQARQKVLASNIANTDTPGYRARDIDFKGLVEEASAALTTTDPRHMLPPSGEVLSPGSGNEADSQTWGDGNNVELDTEVAKMTENGLLYQAAVRLMSTKIKMFQNALGRR